MSNITNLQFQVYVNLHEPSHKSYIFNISLVLCRHRGFTHQRCHSTRWLKWFLQQANKYL